MKIDVYTELLPEDLPKITKEYPEEIDTLLGVLNALGRSVNQLGKQAINITDNLQADLKTVTVATSGNLPLLIGNRFAPQVPKAVLLVNTSQLISVNWEVSENNTIKIKSILGTVAYPITLSLLILW